MSNATRGKGYSVGRRGDRFAVKHPVTGEWKRGLRIPHDLQRTAREREQYVCRCQREIAAV